MISVQRKRNWSQGKLYVIDEVERHFCLECADTMRQSRILKVLVQSLRFPGLTMPFFL